MSARLDCRKRLMLLLDSIGQIDPADFMTAKQIGDCLNRHYPGHPWAVNCQWKQGVLRIQNLNLPMTHGYTIKLLPIWSSSELERQCRIGAGEILERYKLPTGAHNEDRWMSAPTDFKGAVIGDLST